MHKTIEKLIDDTLHGRRIGGKAGSCLVSNQAGAELIGLECDVMDELEEAIREIDASLRDGLRSASAFSGLEYVIGAYLVNGARYNANRAIGFVDSLSIGLLRESIANIPVFFRRMESGYNFGVSPPEEYKEFARRLENSQCDEIASTAKRVVERLSR